MAHPPHDAVRQQAGQGSVDGCVGLAEDACQLRRIDERLPDEGVEQLSFGESQVRILLHSLCRICTSAVVGSCPTSHFERENRRM